MLVLWALLGVLSQYLVGGVVIETHAEDGTHFAILREQPDIWIEISAFVFAVERYGNILFAAAALPVLSAALIRKKLNACCVWRRTQICGATI